MQIGAYSPSSYWLTAANSTTPVAEATPEKQVANNNTQKAAAETGQTIPVSTAILAAQEVESGSASQGQQWLDSVIAKFNAERTAGQQAEPHNEFFKIDVQQHVAQGKVTSAWEPSSGNEVTTVPDEVEGVETGFLNSRYLTMDYLNKAEDLIENHSDIAKQVFNLDDPMHRSVLTYIQRHDFTSQSSAYDYQDELGQQYFEEGQKLLSNPAISAPGTSSMFMIDPEIMAMDRNPFVSTVSQAADTVASQLDQIDKYQAQLDAHKLKEQELNEKLANTSDGVEKALIGQQIQDIQYMQGDLQETLNRTEERLAHSLQRLRDLEQFGIAPESIEDVFNKFFTGGNGNSASSLSELFGNYNIAAANENPQRGQSGLNSIVSEFLDAQAPTRAKYAV